MATLSLVLPLIFTIKYINTHIFLIIQITSLLHNFNELHNEIDYTPTSLISLLNFII
jgi:hypothetical protein